MKFSAQNPPSRGVRVSTSSLVHNNQHLKLTLASIKRRMEKQTMLLTQWNKKERTTDLCNNRDEYQKYPYFFFPTAHPQYAK